MKEAIKYAGKTAAMWARGLYWAAAFAAEAALNKLKGKK